MQHVHLSLVVEDDDSVRALTGTLLRRCGYRVLEASGGREALEVFQERGAIDLLLTDAVMPEMSGRLLAERLTAVQPGLRVLFMSGHTEDKVLRAGVEASEMAFLQKPFTLAALAARVRAVLDVPAR